MTTTPSSFLARHPGFIRRLGYLCFGLCIGLTLVGFLQAARNNDNRNKHAAAEEARKNPPKDSHFPPSPPELPPPPTSK